MDVGTLSIVMSQSKVRQSAGIAVMKMSMNIAEENVAMVTEMMGNVATDPT